MNIVLLDPYYIDSHQRWAEGLQAHSRHDISIFSLPAVHWKWRMHAGVIALADKMLSGAYRPDLVLCTDMADVGLLRGYLHSRHCMVPVVSYFHENQLTYPWSEEDTDQAAARERHYAWINFTSALVSDCVLFNSEFHRSTFLKNLPTFLRAFPDYRPMDALTRITARSYVCYPGLEPVVSGAREPRAVPLLLWNHRWEYDKAPEVFFRCLYRLSEEGVAFELAVAGRAFSRSPDIFEEARARLAAHTVHWGWLPDQVAYRRLLNEASILPVTSRQEFFGYSVMDAVQHNVFPLLPRRLSYPELLPAPEYFYDGDPEIALAQVIRRGNWKYFSGQNLAAPYLWPSLIKRYDDLFEQTVASH
jgi:glycosyltransferase involved in cell wall biosynthesis